MSDIPVPLSVFIAYARRDEAFKDTLIVHLATLKRQGKIRAWQDREIEAGTEWGVTTKQQLESAQIILLLITPYFIASDHCYDLEMQRAIQRHEEGTARVIPIVVKPCDWRGTPFNKLQALPKDAKPISRWDDQDDAFLDVVQGIRRAVETLQSPKGSSPAEPINHTAYSETGNHHFNFPEKQQTSPSHSDSQISTPTRSDAKYSSAKIWLITLSIVVGLFGVGSWLAKPSIETPPSNQGDAKLESLGLLNLSSFLKSSDWKKADQETWEILRRSSGNQIDIKPEKISTLPCNLLKEIDNLWTENSDQKFGFSIQKQIWFNSSKKLDFTSWIDFSDQVGWRINRQWVEYEDISFSINDPKGNLPTRAVGLLWDDWGLERDQILMERLESCQV